MYKLRFILLKFFIVCPLWGTTFWSSPHLLLSNCEDKQDFSLSVNTKAETVVGWFNHRNNHIEIAKYDFVRDQIHPPKICYPCSFDCTLLKVVIAENRDLFALWVDEDDGYLKAAHYSHNKGVWDQTTRVAADAVKDPILKVDVHGNAMIIWSKFTGLENQVQAIYYSLANNSWSPPTSISPIGNNCSLHQFAFDSSGNALVAWKADLFTQQSGSKGIQAVRFDASTQKWSYHLFYFDYTGDYVPESLDVIYDDTDNVVILWNGVNPVTSQSLFQFTSYDVTQKSWGNKTAIAFNEPIKNPKLVNNHEHIYVIWQTRHGKVKLRSLVLNYPGSYLSEKVDIPSNLGEINVFKIKADNYGKINIISSDNRQLQIVEFGRKWQSCARYHDQYNISCLQIDGDGLGNAMALWEKNNQLYYTRGNFLLPPSSFSVRIVEKRFTSKVVFRTVLTWVNPQSPTASRYRLRRNGEIIAELPTSQTEYVDKSYHFYHHAKTVYSISSITDENVESQLSEFIING